MENTAFDIDFFKDLNFTRKQCIICKSYFWTLDKNKNTCGDPACESYSFIGNSPVYKKYTIDEMRDEFINFFKNDELKHKFLEPYPVVPRWRNDVLLVNASIYDFQPQVTSGRVPPPGNPIVMSQPSIRMLDLDLVGKTGRHSTSFEMLCHDSFNYENKYIYWKNETIKYSFRFLTEKLKINPYLITYKEKPWFGGGNAGNAVEVFVRGLEVATLVFMDLKEDDNGSIVIENTKYSRMPLKIVDTGYGLERLVWLSNATPTIYESIFNNTINFILNNSEAKKIDDQLLQKISEYAALIDPYSEDKLMGKLKEFMDENNYSISNDFFNSLKSIRDVYSLADHTKTLLLMFSDYVIPSNVKVGYLARTLIRRCFKFIDEIKFKYDLNYLLEYQYKTLNQIIKNFDINFINNIISIEKEKYDTINKNAYNKVKKYIKNNELKMDDIIKLYESDGLNEDLISDIYNDITGKTLKMPDNFNELLIAKHEKIIKKNKKEEDYPDINTRPLYYDNTKIKEFTAIVLYSGDKKIIVNQTAFYPEGGGQPCDLGYFIYNGKKVNVSNVQKYNNAIVHFLDSDIPVNARIKGFIDYTRRYQLMVHHSATHLLLGILRKYFGEHVWQSGVKKDINESRLDITHYNKINLNDIKNIEDLCFKAIQENKKIDVASIKWNDAIKNYGFRLFEGGFPLSDRIRVVTVEDIDSEGCGGTHLDSTIHIGFIKIIKAETLQEGIQRIIFSAGLAALNYTQSLYNIISKEEEFMKVDESKLYDYSYNLLKNNIEIKKELDKLLKEKIEYIINNNAEYNDINVYNTDLDERELNLLIQGLHKINKTSLIINNNEIIIIGIKGLKSIINELNKNLKLHEKINNSKMYSAISETKISENLIKEILVNVRI